MAKLEDVFVVEADRRESEKWSKIHLFKMGDFWRAYEWSAWLIAVITYNEKVRMTTRDRKPIHVTRMNRTDVEGTYCFVGFPVKSVEKYIPERENFESVGEEEQNVNYYFSFHGSGEGVHLFAIGIIKAGGSGSNDRNRLIAKAPFTISLTNDGDRYFANVCAK